MPGCSVIKAGWDRGLPSDAILVHEVKEGYIEVVSIDPDSQKATVRVWDVPEDSLRRDESDQKLYLIDIGRKRLVSWHRGQRFVASVASFETSAVCPAAASPTFLTGSR